MDKSKKGKGVMMKPGVYTSMTDLSTYLTLSSIGKIYPPVDLRGQLLGFKGDAVLDAGYIYAPYLPLAHSTIVNVGDFRREMGLEGPPHEPGAPQWFDILVAMLEEAVPNNMTMELDVDMARVDIVCDKKSICYIKEGSKGGFESDIVGEEMVLADPDFVDTFEELLSKRIEAFQDPSKNI